MRSEEGRGRGAQWREEQEAMFQKGREKVRKEGVKWSWMVMQVIQVVKEFEYVGPFLLIMEKC